MSNNSQDPTEPEWIYRASTALDRSRFRLAFIDYLVSENIILDERPTNMSILRAMIPYIGKYNKLWNSIDPAQVKTN